MKTRLFILLTTLAFSLTTAFAQSFSSTGSEMMNTGSNYSSPVYGVGATQVDPVFGSNSGPRNRFEGEEEQWEDTDVNPGGTDAPIGAPYILLLFAASAAGVVALRRRRAIER